MKRAAALILMAFVLCLSLLLASCDYQESVDSARQNLMDSAKDLLDPFLNQTKSSQPAGEKGDNKDTVESLPSSDDLK